MWFALGMMKEKRMQSRPGLRMALALACGFSCLLSVAGAHAQDVDDPYFAAKLLLGVGGEGEIEIDGVPGEGEGDLELTYGAALQYQNPLHDYFSLGGQLALRSWQSEAGEDTNSDRNLL